MKKTVLVIFGGTGMEYYATCRLFCDTIAAIDKEKYNVLKIGITPEGKWLLTDAEPAEIKDGKQWIEKPGNTPAYIVPEEGEQKILILEGDGYRTEHVDVAFPMIHGYGGEDGRMQGMLDMSGIPYVGSGMIASALSLDKEYTYIFAELLGFKMPKYCVLRKKEYEENKENIEDVIGIDYPLYVKPMNGGTSVGTSRVANREELIGAIDLAFKYDRRIVIEEEIPMKKELKVSVLGNDDPIVGAPCEEVPGGFYDYDTKALGLAKKAIPADITEEVRKEIEELSLQLYKRLDCRGMARVDFFLTPDDEVYFNEINTIPGMGAQSNFSRMFGVIGIDYETLVQKMIDTAENDSLAVVDAERG